MLLDKNTLLLIGGEDKLEEYLRRRVKEKLVVVASVWEAQFVLERYTIKKNPKLILIVWKVYHPEIAYFIDWLNHKRSEEAPPVLGLTAKIDRTVVNLLKKAGVGGIYLKPYKKKVILKIQEV
jgi:DNA-binding response OmpR family regulator